MEFVAEVDPGTNHIEDIALWNNSEQLPTCLKLTTIVTKVYILYVAGFLNVSWKASVNDLSGSDLSSYLLLQVSNILLSPPTMLF